MNETKATTQPLLWSDERIKEYAARNRGAELRGYWTQFEVEFCMKHICDSYEAELASLRQQLDEKDAQMQERIADAYTHGYAVANGWTGSDDDMRRRTQGGKHEVG